MEISDNEMGTILFVFTLGIFSFQGFSDYLFKWYMDKGTVASRVVGWLLGSEFIKMVSISRFCVK